MMLYTKYESSGPCSFRQEDYWKFHFKTYLLTPWPTYATNWNGVNNFDRGPRRNHSCDVWLKSNKRFQRRCCLKKLLTDARTHGRTTDIEGSQKRSEHFVLKWANKISSHSCLPSLCHRGCVDGGGGGCGVDVEFLFRGSNMSNKNREEYRRNKCNNE